MPGKVSTSGLVCEIQNCATMNSSGSPIRISLLFDNSREVIFDVYNTINAVKPTLPERGMFILAAAVYTMQISKEGDRSPRHPSGE